jgi:archaellum biogenesis ATPase FlaH
MEFNQNYEKLFFNYSLVNPKYLAITREGFYASRELDIMAYLAKKFYDKFKETPSKEQMKLLVQNSNKSKDIVTDSLVDLVYESNIADYDNEWLQRTAESWIKWRAFDGSLLDGIEFIKSSKVNPDNVDSIINKFKELITDRNRINFDKDLGLDFFNPEHHYQNPEDKIASGKNFVDAVTSGGYDKCSLVVYAGEQNIGKSIWLANDASNFVKMGCNTAFITAEMKASKVIKRIGANLLDISMNEYDKYSSDKNYIARKLQHVGTGVMPPGKLFIKKFPTSQATVIDIENYLRDVEETAGIKLNAIVIDYINILSNYRNPNGDNTYMKIKQIAEDLRGMADRNNWLIVTATQIKRSGYDSSDISMDDIAESAGLSHTADMIYGIIQDAIMHSNFEYWLKILKIRDGEGKNTKCRFDVNYEYMRLTESEDVRGSNRAT